MIATTLEARADRATGATDWPRLRSKVAPGASPGRGRGLFAREPIATGEVISRACSIELTSDQCDALEEMLPLGNYYFRHPEDPDRGLLLLGEASLVNHSDDPNADLRFHLSEDVGWVAELFALRDIGPGHEILYRYRCMPWFETA